MKVIAILAALASLLGTACFAYYDYGRDEAASIPTREVVIADFIEAVENRDLDRARSHVLDLEGWPLDEVELETIRRRLAELRGRGFTGAWHWRVVGSAGQNSGRPRTSEETRSLSMTMIKGSRGWAVMRVVLD